MAGSTISLVVASIAYGRKSKEQTDSIEESKLVAKAVLGDKKELDDNRKRGGLLYRVDQIENGHNARERERKFVHRLMANMNVDKDSGEFEMDTAIRDALGAPPATPPTGKLPSAKRALIDDQTRRMKVGWNESELEPKLEARPEAKSEFKQDRFGTPTPQAIPIPRAHHINTNPLSAPPPLPAVLRVPRPDTPLPFPTTHSGKEKDDSSKDK